jgi:hypothetical protein
MQQKSDRPPLKILNSAGSIIGFFKELLRVTEIQAEVSEPPPNSTKGTSVFTKESFSSKFLTHNETRPRSGKLHNWVHSSAVRSAGVLAVVAA